MKRRNFIRTIPSVSFLSILNWHDCFQQPKALKYPNNSKPLIQQVRLKTTTPLVKLEQFYHHQIGFPVVEVSKETIIFQTGLSLLTFEKKEGFEEVPFYHFAFNIPENKILAARAWQMERSPIITTPQHRQEAGFPKEIRPFHHWNARSIFFWDPAGNLVEYIARHDLNNAAKGKFTTKDLLYLSEIAFIVNDVEKEANILASNIGVNQYRNGSSNFKAMGDEMGLLILMKEGRVWEQQTKQTKSPSVYPTKVKLTRAVAPIQLENYPYQLS